MRNVTKKIQKLFVFLAICAAFNTSIIFAEDESMPTSLYKEQNPAMKYIPDVDSATGAAVMNAPLSLPPGRNGMTPNLMLNYHSSHPNGILGVGWNIDFGSITVSTKHKGVCQNCEDTEYIAGGDELILVDSATGQYGPKIEDGAFTKYYLNSVGSEGWTVKTKDGKTLYYGSTESSRLEEPSDSGMYVARWYLDKIIDSNGNSIKISYDKIAPDEDLHQWAWEINIDKVMYMNDTPRGDEYNHEIIFNYTEDRTDKPVVFVAGIALKTGKRLETIVIDLQQASAKKMWYTFEYDQSQHSKRTLLKDVKKYDSDGPVTSIIHTSWKTGTNSAPPFQSEFLYQSEHWHSGYVWFGDFDGDNITDFVSYKSGHFATFISQGDGTFDVKYYNIPPEIMSAWNSNYIKVGDFNGDGKSDLLSFKDLRFTTFFSKGDGTFGYKIVNTPSEIWNSSIVWPGDYNGDGITDILSHKWGNFIIFYFDGTGSYHNGKGETGKPALVSTGINFDIYWAKFCDLNGDGKTDILNYNQYSDVDPRLATFISNGDGTFTAREWKAPYGIWHSGRCRVGDFNGDGNADLYSIKGNSLTTFFSRGDGTFEYVNYVATVTSNWLGMGRWGIVQDLNGDNIDDLYTNCGYDENNPWDPRTTSYVGFSMGDGTYRAIKGTQAVFTPRYTDSYGDTNVAMDAEGDFNGDGIRERIQYVEWPHRFLNHHSIRHDDLLESVTNAYGSTTTIGYTLSSSFSSENTYLPYIIQTVSSITTTDVIHPDAAQKTEYRYSEGYHDLQHREFLGFGHVTKILPDGTTIETWYYDKNDPEANGLKNQSWLLKGKPFYVQKKEPGQSVPYEETEYSWSTPGVWNTEIPYFVKLESKKTTFDNSPNLYVLEEYTYYDTFGSVHSVTTTGTDITPRTVTYEYADYDDWVFRKTSETLTGVLSSGGSTNAIVSKKTYDWTYATDRFTDVTETSVNTTANSLSPAVKKIIDDYGNVEEELSGYRSGNGAFVEEKHSSITYDTTLNAFPNIVTRPSTSRYDNTSADHTTTYKTYDYLFGKPKEVIDENGNLTIFVYDNQGRETNAYYYEGVDDLQREISTSYNDDDYPRSATQQSIGTDTNGGFFVKEYFDGQNRKIQSVSRGAVDINNNPYYYVTLHAYDDMGRQKYTVGPFAAANDDFQKDKVDALNGKNDGPLTLNDVLNETTWVINHYDSKGRVKKIEQSAGIETTYDYNGFTTIITDPDVNTTSNPILYKKSEKKDVLGQIIQVTEHGANNQKTYYCYNAAGSLLTVKRNNPDTLAEITNTITYNSLNQKVEQHDPDMGHWKYAYDTGGNLKEQAFYEGETKTQWQIMIYDDLNRIKSKNAYHVSPLPPEFSQNNPSVEYRYDDTSVQNGNGRLSFVSNTNVVYNALKYDTFGNIRQESKNIKDSNGNFHSDSTQYFRGTSGQINKIIYPTGFTVIYKYHPQTSLIHYVYRDSISPANLIAEITDYTPSGKIKNIRYKNDVLTNYAYYPDSDRIEHILTSKGTTTLQKLSYTYYRSGDIDTITDNLNASNPVVKTYEYDPLHRLIHERTDGAPAPVSPKADLFLYTYDNQLPGIHNVANVKRNGISPVEPCRYDKGNMVSGPDFSDPNSIKTRTIDYNADNMPVRIRIGGVEAARFTYDGHGVRAAKLEGGSDTLYYNDKYEIIGNVPTRYVFAGNLRIAKVTGPNGSLVTTYIHKDHLGSSTVITNVNGVRVNPENIDYFPYGLEKNETKQAVSENYRFTDQEYDRGTGLYNYDARLYDPVIGMFVTADSMLPNIYDPQQLNRYAYCRNNPLKYTDPSGHVLEYAAGLTNREKLVVLGTMQKLTDDKLFYKGNEIKIKSVGKGSKPKGTELVRRIRTSANKMTIDIGAPGSGNTESDVDPAKAISGVGSDVNVSFDPTSDPSIKTKDPTTGYVSGKKRPNQIGLGHEMIHGDRSMRGEAIDYSINDNYTYTDSTGSPITQNVPKEELATVGLKHNTPKDITENDLRDEQGQDDRGAY